MKKNKSNWHKIKNQKHKEGKYRDVYEEQQLDRSTIDELQSYTSRLILGILATILVCMIVWSLFGIITFGVHSIKSSFDSSDVSTGFNDGVLSEDTTIRTNENGGDLYIIEHSVVDPINGMSSKYQACDENGVGFGPIYDNASDVPKPDWYIDYVSRVESNRDAAGLDDEDVVSEYDNKSTPQKIFGFGWWKLLFTLLSGLLFFALIDRLLRRNLDAQNLMNDTADINQYQNDQHIALPEEIQRKFDWFPDVGAHSSVVVSSMISHMALSNKGIKKVKVARRAKEDIMDEDGDIEYYEGELLTDDDGNYIYDEKPLIDKPFMDSLFDASGLPNDKYLRKYYDTSKIDYNPGNDDRLKLKNYDTVADMINGDWELPDYEVQRPAGAYIVDTDAVNTMVLAITRAGKGQTVIEPTIDMWTREKMPNNMIINDPKGELLAKFYVKGTVRGFELVQFNLINPMKTDIYNPLLMAAESAREGNFTKCALYVENIASVFFPLDGGEDPVWPQSANNAFKRAAYGLIDYYLEEEKELRLHAARVGMNPKELEQKLDAMWGKVTLYNCYQLFVQLTSKKLKNPAVEFSKKASKGEYEKLSDDEYEEELNKVEAMSKLWEDRPEIDLLTLYFNASALLPKNEMRTLVDNANTSLKAMSGAEKMMASVYGIAITAMSFFTDPTISTLTSGTPSQNVDLAGLSFPRRGGVRFHNDYIKRYHLTGLQVQWQVYTDNTFTKPMDSTFYHEDTIQRDGWARYYFEGKFPNEMAYLKLQIVNPQTGLLVKTMFFEFTKLYKTSFNGKTFVKDPILDENIVKNGIIVELLPVRDVNGNIVYKPDKTMFKRVKMKDIEGNPYKEDIQTPAIVQTSVRYSEKPKMVFLVTPPHLMKYAKLILILLKQLVDLNFDQSYMTKSNQKPLYKTRFMLDELGNLQSEGHGIDGFETMLSIGLGQEQQFTIILQTLQQLRDVYGESVDKIVQGNTSNIVFLKSTDDSMMDTLQKMSGTTHRVFTNQKTITRDMERIFLKNEGKASYMMTSQEVPVIAYNDMAFISERNSIVFRAGDSPIWNRNETILPMSWKLFENTIKHPGHDYTLQTLPTLSSAKDFDVRKNQPNFQKMLDKRMAQALAAEQACDVYQSVYDYTDYEISQLDPDDYADEILEIINTFMREEANVSEDALFDDFDEMELYTNEAEDNEEQLRINMEQERKFKDYDKGRYAGGTISKSDLMSISGQVNKGLEKDIIASYVEIKSHMWNDKDYFIYKNDGNLYGLNGEPYIIQIKASNELQIINKVAKDGDSSVFSEEDIDTKDLNAFGTYEVKEEFFKFLSSLDEWKFANEEFDKQMMKRMM